MHLPPSQPVYTVYPCIILKPPFSLLTVRYPNGFLAKILCPFSASPCVALSDLLDLTVLGELHPPIRDQLTAVWMD